MQNMSLLQFILVSFPEQVIFIFLGAFSIGKYSYFKTRSNYYRIFITASLITFISYILREKLGLVSESTLLLLFIDIILIILIMKFKFYEAVTASVLGFSMIMLVEISFSLIIAPILGINGERELYQNASNFVIFVLSVRLLHILLAVFLYRFKIKIVNMESSNIKTKEYYIQLVVYLISLCTIGFLTFLMTRMLLFEKVTIASSQNMYLLKINIYISLFVTIILTLAVKSIHDFYKNKSTLNNNEIVQSIEYIYRLIDEQNINEAKDALISLKTHIKEN
ncbi:hypothetical protein [Acetivibrio mesophilus]|uniref:Uncharacterized protein n=1 Tax=Acetivibrio mesophilus TaxID=2487273 RepID=A0A4Q0I3E3_9FIRM|nr:hypothetical protein [Acetivibrio mesophilus]ODM27182.1 hypothetical protein A7W90_13720 [Clostridium sp. Bc-iso-3]RXE58784.1 hypothetical protein EFD62_10800 [Acetivibrio mesophilus]